MKKAKIEYTRMKRKEKSDIVFNVPLLDLRRQYNFIKAEIDAKIQKVLESGRFILGENVRCFEEEFARYCHAKYGVGVASGTDALTLALKSLGVCKGHEVITAANTFIATVDAISHCQATPILVDIDSETYNIDVSEIREKITKRTKAIVPVHLYGHPVDIDPIVEVAEESGIYVIEDACQAHGALYKGKMVGGLGDCACFSFFPSKNLGAYGDGGMVVTDREDIAEHVRMLRNYGQREKYHHCLVGYNSRLDEVQAAILRVKLKYLDDWINDRRKNASKYTELLSDLAEISTPIEKEYAKHVYYLYVIRIKNRDQLRRALSSKGISTDMHYPIPVHLHESYESLGLKKGYFPRVETSAKEILSLPMFPELRDAEIEYVCEAIKSFLT